MRTRSPPDVNRIGTLKEVGMKATGIFLNRMHGRGITMSPLGDAALPAASAAAIAEPVERAGLAVPHILHIDRDSGSAHNLAALLTPEARVTHVQTLAGARQLLRQHIFSAVVIDPDLPDGDAADLLPALSAVPLLVYSARQPAWRGRSGVYLAKPWATPRQLWTAIAILLGIATPTCAGD
jgi:two-component system phosphate regulon response regulator OmpR